MKLRDCLIGIDEVGRGALAGPVVVVAAMMPRKLGAKLFASPTRKGSKIPALTPGLLKDSKKLTARQREAWCKYFLKHPDISFAIARVYPRQIEKRNISGAANLAALRACRRLIYIGNFSESARSNRVIAGKKSANDLSKIKIFLDGGLYLKNKKWQRENIPNAKTAPKADETIPAVAIASIIAKVHRDQFMAKIAKKYPGYGFEIHKGYGTKLHQAAIKKIGPCEIHRKTFLAQT